MRSHVYGNGPADQEPPWLKQERNEGFGRKGTTIWDFLEEKLP